MRIASHLVLALATLGLGQSSNAQETNNTPPAQVQKVPKERTHGLEIDFKDGLSRDDVLKTLDGYTVLEMLPVSPSRNIFYVRLGSVHNTPDLLFRLRRTNGIESAQISGRKPVIKTASEISREVDEMLERDKKEYKLDFNFKNDISDEGAKRILESIGATDAKLISLRTNTYRATVKTSLPLDEYYKLLRKFNAFDNVSMFVPQRSKF